MKQWHQENNSVAEHFPSDQKMRNNNNENESKKRIECEKGLGADWMDEWMHQNAFAPAFCVCSPTDAFYNLWNICAFTLFLSFLCFLISTSVVGYFVEERINNPFPRYNGTSHGTHTQRQHQQQWAMETKFYSTNSTLVLTSLDLSVHSVYSSCSAIFNGLSNEMAAKHKIVKHILRAFWISSFVWWMQGRNGSWTHALSRCHEWNETNEWIA